VLRALLGPAGFALKVKVVDARLAAASGGGGKGKNSREDFIVMDGVKIHYGDSKAALAEAGGVEEAELFEEAKLARSSLLLSQRLYEELPADQPRFPEQAAMISRLLFTIVLDEANRLNNAASSAFWVPLVCTGALGPRGSVPVPLLPGVNLVIAPFNPTQPHAEDARVSGESLLCPRPAEVDRVTGARIQPPIELVVEADGTVVWDARAVTPALTSVTESAMLRRTNTIAQVVPDDDGSMPSRLAASRAMCRPALPITSVISPS
jgi:hypothetical protein